MQPANWCFHSPAAEPPVRTANVAAYDRDVVLLAALQDPVDELLRDAFQLLVAAITVQDLERLDARDHGEGVAGEGAGLVHGPRGRDCLHDLLLPAKGACKYVQWC